MTALWDYWRAVVRVWGPLVPLPLLSHGQKIGFTWTSIVFIGDVLDGCPLLNEFVIQVDRGWQASRIQAWSKLDSTGLIFSSL